MTRSASCCTRSSQQAAMGGSPCGSTASSGCVLCRVWDRRAVRSHPKRVGRDHPSSAAQALRFDSCLQSVALVVGQPPVASADQVVFGEVLTVTGFNHRNVAGDRQRPFSWQLMQRFASHFRKCTLCAPHLSRRVLAFCDTTARISSLAPMLCRLRPDDGCGGGGFPGAAGMPAPHSPCAHLPLPAHVHKDCNPLVRNYPGRHRVRRAAFTKLAAQATVYTSGTPIHLSGRRRRYAAGAVGRALSASAHGLRGLRRCHCGPFTAAPEPLRAGLSPLCGLSQSHAGMTYPTAAQLLIAERVTRARAQHGSSEHQDGHAMCRAKD